MQSTTQGNAKFKASYQFIHRMEIKNCLSDSCHWITGRVIRYNFQLSVHTNGNSSHVGEHQNSKERHEWHWTWWTRLSGCRVVGWFTIYCWSPENHHKKEKLPSESVAVAWRKESCLMSEVRGQIGPRPQKGNRSSSGRWFRPNSEE